jgi:hypothetical protein
MQSRRSTALLPNCPLKGFVGREIPGALFIQDGMLSRLEDWSRGSIEAVQHGHPVESILTSALYWRHQRA